MNNLPLIASLILIPTISLTSITSYYCALDKYRLISKLALYLKLLKK